jgi:hypothetical protein
MAMVMFKAKFQPLTGKPAATGQQQQQPQPVPPQPPQVPQVPPIEEERGPQHPVREPEPLGPPERARTRSRSRERATA